MDSPRDSEFDARLARLEAAVAGLERSIAALMSERELPRERAPDLEPEIEEWRSSYPAEAPPLIPQRRANRPDGIAEGPSSWFPSRTAEWWLSRVGIGFVIVGILLLYGYAVNRGWIRPLIRVLAGAAVGGLLVWAAGRVRSRAEPADRPNLGLRELLLGGALAVWFVTSYAAAVWYQLIPIPAARLVFFLLAIAATWIALEEHREVFALVAVVTGFATPFILPAPVQSMTELSLYLGAVTAIGLIIYLLRGWQRVVWITFFAFWLSIATQIPILTGK